MVIFRLSWALIYTLIGIVFVAGYIFSGVHVEEGFWQYESVIDDTMVIYKSVFHWALKIN